MKKNETGGWLWAAFLFGPFWYLSKKITRKGSWLLILCIATFFCAAPFVCIYCGLKGKGDLYDQKLREKSKIDLNNL